MKYAYKAHKTSIKVKNKESKNKHKLKQDDEEINNKKGFFCNMK
jgi:hypothetical protein